MSRSNTAPRALALRRLVLSSVAALLALGLAIGAGVLLVELMMSPPDDELRTLAVYLTLAGVASAGLGSIALRVLDTVLGLTLRTRAFVSSAMAGAVALLNVIIVAQLMFVSTDHDLKLLVAIVVFSAVITAFFSSWVAAMVAGRIEDVAAGVQALAQGDFSHRLGRHSRDEVGRLSRDVDSLAARLQAAEDQRAALDRERKELTTAISHDLRTPLASMRAMTEALSDGVVEDAAEIQRYYATMRREIERLSRMIDDLFELSQLDAGVLKLDRQRISIQDIAAEVVDAMQAAARLADVDLTLESSSSPPPIEMDGRRIERAVANLVRNALEHTSSGGQVRVAVTSADGHVEVRVADTGDGIDPQDLSRIWERFYRAEKSRRRSGDGDGAGLGLAITRGIVQAHGGSVDVTSAPDRGTTFVVRLPIG